MDFENDDGSYLPKENSNLGIWKLYALEVFGKYSYTYKYIDELVRKFGADYLIELSSIQFLQHLALINYTSTHEADVFYLYEKFNNPTIDTDYMI